MTDKEPTKATRRGRPQGTGKDDTAYLTAIAEALYAGEAATPQAAIKQVLARSHPDGQDRIGSVSRSSVLHRLAEKWKREGAARMVNIRQRKQAEQWRRMEAGMVGFVGALAQAADRARPYLLALNDRLNAYGETPEGKRVLDFAQRYAALRKDPAIAKWDGIAAALQNDPVLKKWSGVAQALKNDPVLSKWAGLSLPAL